VSLHGLILLETAPRYIHSNSSVRDTTPEISVVIPTHNEALFLPKCLAAMAIKESASISSLVVEVVVVLNRSTDKTEKIATDFGANVGSEYAKNVGRDQTDNGSP